MLTLWYFLKSFGWRQTFCGNSPKQTTFSYSVTVYYENIHITRESKNVKFTQLIEHVLLWNRYSWVIYERYSNFCIYKRRWREKKTRRIKYQDDKAEVVAVQVSNFFYLCTYATVFHIVMKSRLNILILKLRILYPKSIVNRSVKRETNATAVPLTQSIITGTYFSYFFLLTFD